MPALPATCQACFARDFSAAVGIDDDEEAISQARARAFEIDASTRRTLGMGKLTLEFVCGSFPNIDWSAAGVALCDCEGMDDQAIGALARRARLLAPGSVLVCLGRPCFDDALATAFAGRARIGGRNRDVYAMRRTAGDGSSPGATAEDTAGSSTTPASESSGPRRWAIDEAAAAAATAATSSTPVGVAGAATTGGAAPSLRIPERVARLQRRHRRPNGAHDARGRQAQQQGQVPGESMATPKGSIPAVTRLNADAQAVRANTPMAVWKRLAAVRTDVGLPPSSPQGSALLDRKRGHGGGAHGDVGRVPSFGDSEDSSGDSERGVMRLVSGDLVGASSPGLGHGAEDDGEEEEEEETGEESSKGDDADGFPADDGPAEVAGTHEPAVRPARHSFMSVASAESVGSVEQEARRRVAPTAGADTAGRARLGSDGATGETAAPQRRFSQPDSRPPPPPSLHLGQRSNAAASPHGHQRVAALRAGAEKKEPSSPLDDKLLLRKHRGPKR